MIKFRLPILFIFVYLILSMLEIMSWQFYRSQGLIFAIIGLFVIQIIILTLFLVLSLVFLVKKWKGKNIYSTVPLVTLIFLNILIIFFVPIMRFNYKQWFFLKNYEKYETAAYKIYKKIDKNYNNWYFLPKKVKYLSSEGKVWVLRKNKEFNIIFYFTKTMWNTDGMLYSPTELVLEKPKYFEKRKTKWFYVEYD